MGIYCNKCGRIKLFADMPGQYEIWKSYNLCWRCQLKAVGFCLKDSHKN